MRAVAGAAALAVAAADMSALGDPGLRTINFSVSFEAWSFCNGAIQPPAYQAAMPWSPRAADCLLDADGTNAITAAMNGLAPGDPLPAPYNSTANLTSPNVYAAVKDVYLGDTCAASGSRDWSYWTVMFKSGILNHTSALCPATAPGAATTSAPAVGNGIMNQPLMVHSMSAPGSPLPYGASGITGFFAGTYDWLPTWSPQQWTAMQDALSAYTLQLYQYRLAELNGTAPPSPPLPSSPLLAAASFMSAQWYRNVSGSGSWTILNSLLTTPAYPWLMNYFRSDGVRGGNGGWPYDARGVMRGPVPTLGTSLQVRLRVLQAGQQHTQFYLPEISGCWRLDGSPCSTGPDVSNDVTRYICYIISPAVKGACSATNQGACPPVHYRLDGTPVLRNDTAAFPYECYYLWCAPPNGVASGGCDPYSNPVPQEIIQLLPCSEWAPHGFPSTPGQGWVGDDRLWQLDVGTLGARLYLFGDNPNAAAAAASAAAAGLPPYPGWGRSWVSFEIGPEQMDSSGTGLVRWEVSEWDVLVAANATAA